jgi:YD repeat-containing protein
MAKAIRTIRKFNQLYKSFSFSDFEPKAEEEFLESIIELDANGNVLLESKFESSGELEEKNTFSYESHGKLAEHVLLYAAEDVTEKRMLNRDEKGRLLEEIKYYGDDSGERTTYVYDDKDNLIERKYYDEEGDFQTQETFAYDDKGSLAEHKKFDKNGKIEEHHTFAHDDSDHSVIETELNPDGSLLSKTVFRFDANGKELTSMKTTADGKLISAVNTVYDEKGNVLEKQYKDFYSKTIRYAYDEENRCISNELYDGNGLLLRKNGYEFDDDGNVKMEHAYEMDTTRGGRDRHFGTRYEYDYH